MQGQLLGSGNVNKSHKLDKLTSDDILYQIYCLREWFLYLTEDEHLQKKQPKTVGKTVGLVFLVRTIWEISCWYLYSFFFSLTSAEVVVVFLAGVITAVLSRQVKLY